MVVTALMVVLPAFVPAHAGTARTVLLGARILVPAAAIVAWLAFTMMGRRGGTARFLVRDRSFAVPDTGALLITVAARWGTFAFFAGWLVDLWARRDSLELTGVMGEVLLTGAALLLLPWGVMAAWTTFDVWCGRPLVALTPAAIVVRDPLGRRSFPWEALVAWPPARTVDPWTLVLPVGRPDLVVKRGLVRSGTNIALQHADVHPWFFADAALFYVLHPERRAGIGTAEEYARLRADLGLSGASTVTAT